MQCRETDYLEIEEGETCFLLPKHAHIEAKCNPISAVFEPPDLLLARTVHDAKLPLQMILCEMRLMEDLLKGVPSGIPEACRDRCASVFKNCYRLLRFINHFSDDVLVQSGRSTLCFAACELRGTLTVLCDSARDYVKRCGMTLRFYSPDTDVVVWGDREKISRMVLNYLSNALKYSNKGGVVTLCLKKVGSLADISVTDEGGGVPEHFVPYLFERYRTNPADGKRGTGLGLSIVRELARLHGGEAFYEPTAVGSRFSFCLPLSSATPLPVPARPEPEPDYIKIELAEVLEEEP